MVHSALGDKHVTFQVTWGYSCLTVTISLGTILAPMQLLVEPIGVYLYPAVWWQKSQGQWATQTELEPQPLGEFGKCKRMDIIKLNPCLWLRRCNHKSIRRIHFKWSFWVTCNPQFRCKHIFANMQSCFFVCACMFCLSYHYCYHLFWNDFKETEKLQNCFENCFENKL